MLKKKKLKAVRNNGNQRQYQGIQEMTAIISTRTTTQPEKNTDKPIKIKQDNLQQYLDKDKRKWQQEKIVIQK